MSARSGGFFVRVPRLLWLMAAIAALHAGGAAAGGMCMAPWAPGPGLQGGAGAVSSLVTGLLG
ncbi:MAG TPA: hypothetical protein VN324_16090, partial [Quisquiliibacterium sp.]|nr:hypothetical protein [Quisquiliibacterium sp.]